MIRHDVESGEKKRAWFRLPLVLVAVSLCVGIYAVIVGSLADQKVALVLLVVPVFLGLVAVPGASSILLALLIIGLAFSARFRLPGFEFHPGGAELSIAPLDFALFILALPLIPRIGQVLRKQDASLRLFYGAFTLFLAAHLLSLIPATDYSFALLEVLRLLKMALLVTVIALYVNSRERLYFVLYVLLVLMIVQGGLATIQSIFRTSFGLDFLGEREFWSISNNGVTFGRAGGTLGHANVLANFFEVLTPVAFSLVLYSKARRDLRLLAAGAVLAGVLGVILSFSRAGWAALILGLLFCLFQFRKHLPKTRVVLALVATGIFSAVISLIFRDVIVARFVAFWDGSRLVRVITAETAVNIIQANPVLGVGINNYGSVSAEYVLQTNVVLARIAAAIVHNIFLLYGAELGLVGLFTFILLLLSVAKLAQAIINGSDSFLAALAAGISAGIFSLIAHGMWDWLFRYDPVYTLFWFCVGLLVAIRKLEPEPDSI